MDRDMILFFLPALFFACEAIFYALTRKRFVIPVRLLMECVILIFYPMLFAALVCHTTSSLLTLALYVLVIFCVMAYFFSYRLEFFDKKSKLVINIFLAIGSIINVVIASLLVVFEKDGYLLACIGNLPIILAFGLAMLRNYRTVKTDKEVFGY